MCTVQLYVYVCVYVCVYMYNMYTCVYMYNMRYNMVHVHVHTGLFFSKSYHGNIFGHVMSLRGDYECSKLAFYM